MTFIGKFGSRYSEEITAFFEGTLSKMLYPDGDNQEYCAGHSREKGHVWIVRHGSFETLTVEPPEGGQYEIAVRFTNKESRDSSFKYVGYAVNDDGFLVGFGTRGH